MHWVNLTDFARLEIALCSTTSLCTYINADGPLVAQTCTINDSPRTCFYLDWAVRRKISVRSIKLNCVEAPFENFLPFVGANLVAVDLYLNLETNNSTAQCIAQNCPNLLTLKLREFNLRSDLRQVFDGCGSLQTLKLVDCVGVFDLHELQSSSLQSLSLSARLHSVRFRARRASHLPLQKPAPFPALTHLTLNSMYFCDDDYTLPLLVAGGQLSGLLLHNVVCPAAPILQATAAALLCLQSLNLYFHASAQPMSSFHRTLCSIDSCVLALLALASVPDGAPMRVLKIMDGEGGACTVGAVADFMTHTLTLSMAVLSRQASRRCMCSAKG
jgi:hypothetical protein